MAQMKRWATTHETMGMAWDFHSRSVLIVDAETEFEAAQAHARIVRDPMSGRTIHRPHDNLEVIGVAPMVPVVELTGSSYVPLVTSDADFRQAVGVLLWGYIDARSVRIEWPPTEHHALKVAEVPDGKELVLTHVTSDGVERAVWDNRCYYESFRWEGDAWVLDSIEDSGKWTEEVMDWYGRACLVLGDRAS